jgi:glutathione S-transferase
MSELVFYTNPMSRGRIVRWMLEEVGAEHDTVILQYGPEMKSPDYLTVNPMGKVPAIRHDGEVVTECAAICAYLAEAFPEAGLAPRENERAAYYRWLFFCAGPVEAAVTNASFGFDLPDDPQAQRRAGHSSVDAVADALATMLADGRPHVTGERFTAADVYVGAHIIWGLQFGSLPERPGLADYAERLTSRPAAIRARDLDEALTPEQG